MVIGVLEIELFIPGNDFLKGKRAHLKRLLASMRNNFNVSAAEVDCQDMKRAVIIAAVHVGNDNRRVNQALSNLVNMLESSRELQILDCGIQII